MRQIAFCDFTLFEEHPEFYATYKLINEKNIDWIYTNKFIISNMDLTRPDLATEEDRAYKLDDWCKLFKAETWEEMKMLAVKNETIGKAISGVWQLTEEERIREQCQAREEWIINDRWKTEKIAELTQANEELLENAKIQKNTIADQESTIANQEVELAKYRAQFGPLEE